ncbi:hypothetical protein NP603_06365 [Methylomonas sp. SURF-1]|uniref:Coiled-coil protein n=1 Tax=Methylomonas aurea TaxID=2952224 RepID=A0ABT1UFT8_9GAMM|nr:hypothetical protein [Methylomonas sp. SURF-1]MCQ8180723.1 hypothetical protein [Methylomonas sp. SURF-1]
MHQTLTIIKQLLENIVSQIRTTIPNNEPFGAAQGNWTFPGLTRDELIDEAQSIIDLIDTQSTDEIGEHEQLISDYGRRLQFLHQNTIPNIWGNAAQGVPAYIFTLNGLRKALEPVLNPDGHAEAIIKLKKLSNQLRSLEARLNGLEPRTASLKSMVERIERAYNAAEQLPTDLESLQEARQTIKELVQDSNTEHGRIAGIRHEIELVNNALSQRADDAKAVLERCETAYAAATSVGLAAAFSERSNALNKTTWIWTTGLIFALGLGSFFGSKQLQSLSSLIESPNASSEVIALNLLLSLLSIGAPVWFAWLATKQIGQRFRLAEDYAYKASISRAYEGFRREASRFDNDMEERLLASALTRLDEIPLRLVETQTHGSPWHELASSDTVKQAIKLVPGFTEQIRELANKTLSTIAASKEKPSAKAVSEVEQ